MEQPKLFLTPSKELTSHFDREYKHFKNISPIHTILRFYVGDRLLGGWVCDTFHVLILRVSL
jgi:hypothetical protein